VKWLTKLRLTGRSVVRATGSVGRGSRAFDAGSGLQDLVLIVDGVLDHAHAFARGRGHSVAGLLAVSERKCC